MVLKSKMFGKTIAYYFNAKVTVKVTSFKFGLIVLTIIAVL